MFFNAVMEKRIKRVLQVIFVAWVLVLASCSGSNSMLKKICQFNCLVKDNLLVFYSMFLFMILMFVVLAYTLYQKKLKKQKLELLYLQKETEKWHNNYLQVAKEIEQNKKELIALKKDRSVVVMQMQNRINMLNRKIKIYEKQQMAIYEEEVFCMFKNMTSARRNTPQPTDDDWFKLEKLFQTYYPICYKLIKHQAKMTLMELRVCVLTRLSFSNSEMMVLLGSSQSSISNVKLRINKRLFNENSSKTLFKNLASDTR